MADESETNEDMAITKDFSVGPSSRTQTGTGQRQRTRQRMRSRGQVSTRDTMRNVPETPLTDRLPTQGSLRRDHSHLPPGAGGDSKGSRVRSGARTTRESALNLHSRVVEDPSSESRDRVGQLSSEHNAFGSSRAASTLRAPCLYRARSDLIRETVAELQQDLEPFLFANQGKKKLTSFEKGSEYYDTDCESECK